MKKMRVLVAAVAAAFALTLLPAAPAHATHHCAQQGVIDDDYGIAYAVWLACEDGVHHPGAYARFVVCWLTAVC
jgi:hypothetical protein